MLHGARIFTVPTFARTKSPSVVGKYTIHGASGLDDIRYFGIFQVLVFSNMPGVVSLIVLIRDFLYGSWITCHIHTVVPSMYMYIRMYLMNAIIYTYWIYTHGSRHTYIWYMCLCNYLHIFAQLKYNNLCLLLNIHMYITCTYIIYIYIFIHRQTWIYTHYYVPAYLHRPCHEFGVGRLVPTKNLLFSGSMLIYWRVYAHICACNCEYTWWVFLSNYSPFFVP